MWGRSITFVFVAVWVGAGAVWIILDWMGNPNRGAFRPAGRRGPRNFRQRLAERARHRAQDDAAVRATLRERYGRSSLRLLWSDDRELRVLESDSRLVTDPLHAKDPVEPTLASWPLLLDAEFDQSPVTSDPQPQRVPSPSRGWKVGAHPLALTRAGTAPSNATIRARVWKNLATGMPSDHEQLERMRAGRPPRRASPSSDKVETGRVDLASGLAYWPGETTETFDIGLQDHRNDTQPDHPGR